MSEERKQQRKIRPARVIDLVESDKEGNDTFSEAPPESLKMKTESLATSRKRARTTRADAVCSQPYVASKSIPSPIKLLATRQDEDIRSRRETPQTHPCYVNCWTLRELLRMDRNPHDDHDNNATNEKIEWILVSNFMIDFGFWMEEAPELLSIPLSLIFYHHANGLDTYQKVCTGRVEFLQRDPSVRSETVNTTPIPFGCHHTKLFLVGYSTGRLRVIIHTANLLEKDVHWKCQGAFVQDFFRKQNPYATSEFQDTLCRYLSTYRYKGKHRWHSLSEQEPCFLLDEISEYDFSTANGILIPSAPGFHRHSPNATCSHWGYESVHHAIQRFVSDSARGKSIVCQFSSIGSLSPAYLKSLWEAWDVNTVFLRKKYNEGKRQPLLQQDFQLVYPTVQEIQSSVEGLAGGGSVPGTVKNVFKPFLQSLWHRWTGHRTSTAKSRNVPHIKTYYQVDENDQGMLWFVLGSHNLSKAAWGEHQNGTRGSCFKVFHWELGVFLSPQTIGVDRLLPVMDSNDGLDRAKLTTLESDGSSPTSCQIPLPYAFRPKPYYPEDTAWTVDVLRNAYTGEGMPN